MLMILLKPETIPSCSAKKWSNKFRKSHKKTPALESRIFWCRCFLVNFLWITPFLKNPFGWLLLHKHLFCPTTASNLFKNDVIHIFQQSISRLNLYIESKSELRISNPCEIAHYGKSWISVFQDFFASTNKQNFHLAGRLDTRLSFYEILTLS